MSGEGKLIDRVIRLRELSHRDARARVSRLTGQVHALDATVTRLQDIARSYDAPGPLPSGGALAERAAARARVLRAIAASKTRRAEAKRQVDDALGDVAMARAALLAAEDVRAQRQAGARRLLEQRVLEAASGLARGLQHRFGDK